MLLLGHRKDVGGARDQAGLAGGNAVRGDVPPSVGWAPSQAGFRKRPHAHLGEACRGCFCCFWSATPPAQQRTADRLQPLT